jgi:hypothetical protein
VPETFEYALERLYEDQDRDCVVDAIPAVLAWHSGAAGSWRGEPLEVQVAYTTGARRRSRPVTLAVTCDIEKLRRHDPEVQSKADRYRTGRTVHREHLTETAAYGLAFVAISVFLPGRRVVTMRRHCPPDIVLDSTPGALRGVAVWTKSDFLFPGAGQLVDWLCPVDDDAAMTSLVAECERITNERGCPVLATLFPQMNPRFLKFQAMGFMVYGTTYFLVVIPFDNRGKLFYREQWFHTSGDSDLV